MNPVSIGLYCTGMEKGLHSYMNRHMREGISQPNAMFGGGVRDVPDGDLNTRPVSTTQGTTMRYLAVLFVVMIFLAGKTTPTVQSEPQAGSRNQVVAHDTEKAELDSMVQCLLTSAATDFLTHGPAGPISFRDVRLGHIISAGAEKQYRLCGQFMRTQPETRAQWTPFATIKTSDYEQWIGGTAAAFCQDSSMIWNNVGNLSSLLESRLESLR